MSQVFALGIPVTEKILRTVVVYAGLAVLIRLAGKRGLAQLNSFDLVVVLLLSNVVQNAIIGNDNSLTGGLLGAVVLVGVNSVVVRVVSLSDRLTMLFEGTPTTLVADGRYDVKALRREGLRMADVATALRAQNANNVSDVASAVLEPGGSVVVTLREDEQPADRHDVAGLHQRLDALETRLLTARAERG